MWDKVLCEKSLKENMLGGHLLVAQSKRARCRFRLDKANNSKTHACDSISIQQSAREHWNGAMNTQRIWHYCWPLFSCENALFARIFRLNPIFLTYDEQQRWIRWIRHTHTYTHTWSNDTTLIELNDRSDFEIKKKLLHYDFAVVLFKSLMDLWTPSLSFDCWKFRLHFWGTKYGSTVTDI